MAAPTVSPSLAGLAISAPTLTILGTGFDAATASANTVVLSNGAVGTVTAATATSLTVTLSAPPTSAGNLTAVVTSFGGSSGAAVVVATVVAAPVPVASVAYIPNPYINTVTQCAIAANGTITSCAVPPTPTGGWQLALPQAIAIANNIA